MVFLIKLNILCYLVEFVFSFLVINVVMFVFLVKKDL